MSPVVFIVLSAAGVAILLWLLAVTMTGELCDCFASKRELAAQQTLLNRSTARRKMQLN